MPLAVGLGAVERAEGLHPRGVVGRARQDDAAELAMAPEVEVDLRLGGELHGERYGGPLEGGVEAGTQGDGEAAAARCVGDLVGAVLRGDAGLAVGAVVGEDAVGERQGFAEE